MCSIKFLSWVGKNLDYMTNLEFSSRVEVSSRFDSIAMLFFKRSLIFSRDVVSTRFNKLKFQLHIIGPLDGSFIM